MSMRKLALDWLIAIVGVVGMKLRDKDGNVLCKGILIAWAGKLHVIGLPNHVRLRPVPAPKPRLTYRTQTILWEAAGPPDFPRLNRARATVSQPLVCHVIICHLPPETTERLYHMWQAGDPAATLLVAYGGIVEDFSLLSKDINAVFVEDPTLRTKDHARERQQYSGVSKAASDWIKHNAAKVTHIHLAEFDVVPLVPNLGQQLVNALQADDADVMGFGLVDLTGTIHPHYSHELAEPDFLDYLASFSCRELGCRTLSMFGFSSVWTLGSFEELAQLCGCPRAYLEIAMPSLAHHLGYRVRPFPEEQSHFVSVRGDLTSEIEKFREKGAWMVHPCKNLWEIQSPDLVSRPR